MTDTRKISRRGMISAAAGAAASVVTAGLLAQTMTPTPANPEGPFYSQRNQVDTDTDLTLIKGHRRKAEGEVIRVIGEVMDESGQPIEGVQVEIWQANAYGRYRHEDDPSTAKDDPDFQGRGTVRTDARGRYSFVTIKPGAYDAEEGWTRPPHIHFKVWHRSYRTLTTQMYFAGEPLNETDRLLQSVPEEVRDSLIVEFSQSGSMKTGHFTIVLASAN